MWKRKPFGISVEVLSVLAGILLIVVVLWRPVFIGVADNGDFLRIMNTAGLQYYDASESYEDRFFSYSHERFAYDAPLRGFYPSSQVLVVWLARTIASIINGNYFNIRILGAIYTLLLLSALWLLVKYNKPQTPALGLAIGGVLLFVFFDMGYLAYFHSLYGEPVSMLGLLLAFALGLRLLRRSVPDRTGIVLLFLAVLFLILAKIQNAPLGLLFTLIFLRLAWLYKDTGWKRLAWLLSGLLLLSSITLYATAPGGLKHINLYQTVFYGILYQSPDVKADLASLGLPQELEVLAGTNYFESGTAISQTDDALEEMFFNRISHKDVLLFYIKHPVRLWDNMKTAAESAFSIRPYYLGNYEKQEQLSPGALSFTFSGWSELKNRWLPHRLEAIVLFFVLYLGAAVHMWIKSRDTAGRIRAELVMLLGGAGLFAFVTPVLGDGLADIGKHLFLFNVCMDMMMIVLLCYGFRSATHYIQPSPEVKDRPPLRLISSRTKGKSD